MIVRHTGSVEGVVKSTSAQKLRELEELIGSPTEGKSLTMPAGVSLTGLTAQLFRKAPAELIHSRSLDDLARIGMQAARCLSSFSAEGMEPFVSMADPSSCSLTFALKDRPFIVRSASECARVFGCSIRVYLHPIISSGSERISLSYIETEPLSEERFTLFARKVESALRDVVLATDDFTPMLERASSLARTLRKHVSPEDRDTAEVAEFLEWLTDGSFIFLGSAQWGARDGVEGSAIRPEPDALLGLFRTEESYRAQLLDETLEDASSASSSCTFTKLRIESQVHRRLRMSHICVPERDASGKPVRIHSFVGMLSAKALVQDTVAIPIVRGKLRELIESEQVYDNSYDHKYIVDTIERMPTDEVLRLDMPALKNVIDTAIGEHSADYTRLSVHIDPSRRGAFVLVVVPRDRFNAEVRDKIQNTLEATFFAPAGTAEYHLDFTLDPQVKIYFYIPLGRTEDLPTFSLEKLEDEIARLSRAWLDNLEEKILESEDLFDPEEVLFRFGRAFPAEYQAVHSVDDAARDIASMVRLTLDTPLQVEVSTTYRGAVPYHEVILYRLAEEISVSRSLPVLENAGLEVINSNSYLITLREGDPIHVHRLHVKPKPSLQLQDLEFPPVFAKGLAEIFESRAENDALNSLLLTGPLDIRAISVLRGYSCLLWQVNKFATRGAIFDALASVPAAAVTLWELFELRFQPEKGGSAETRRASFEEGLDMFRDLLREVKEITKDRILRSLSLLLEHTVRTNFYQPNRQALALKVHSEKVDIMPSPRPLYEIFVRSPRFEGVHLRASKVARGGLRWSERTEDYRAEVLGLMKTQTVKNVLIVPSGAKGGFCLRHLPKDPAEVPKAVEACYKEFIRALLSVADNRIEEQVVHPQRTVIYDEPDPYFVVAADKGTATFSDIANRIAVDEYQFWLGDAFASGGSKGYDHKLYGITAKGAWECVKRHFHDLGLDHERETFTAVGIGDMSGDVFGNGLLLSDKVRLLAAFNHKHVFIDPNPDADRSFLERKRLFALPRSQWSDYDPSLISSGGGVFGRFDKEIALTPEIRSALSIPDHVPAVVNGEELIAHVLRAKCDLLWNGGIGTYVKSSVESHADVNDGHNDRVRINADELRARVIGEGGNLGFTPRARIEYALRGGKLNTDAIDNSAGVDLSDHEVNIKILFSQLLRDGTVSVETRDEMMVQMSEEVCTSVLDHNRSHATMLSLAEARSRMSVTYFQSLLRQMHKMGYVNRVLDFLPDDEELTDRANRKGGLTRPELALCLAAVKMWIKGALIHSELVNDPLLKEYLLNYFPEMLRERFPKEILAHPLGSNIIATQVTNTLVDAVGITFIHRMCLNHSVPPATVMKCVLAAELLLGSNTIRCALSPFDNARDNDLFLEMRRHVSNSLRDAAAWFLASHGYELKLGQMVERYRESYQSMVDGAERILHGDPLATFSSQFDRYRGRGVSDEIARQLALFPVIGQLLELLYLAGDSKQPIRIVSAVHAKVLEKSGLKPLFDVEHVLETSNKWEHQLLVTAYNEMRRSVSRLTTTFLERGIVEEDAVERVIASSAGFDELTSSIEEVRLAGPTVAAVAVIARQFHQFYL